MKHRYVGCAVSHWWSDWLLSAYATHPWSCVMLTSGACKIECTWHVCAACLESHTFSNDVERDCGLVCMKAKWGESESVKTRICFHYEVYKVINSEYEKDRSCQKFNVLCPDIVYICWCYVYIVIANKYQLCACVTKSCVVFFFLVPYLKMRDLKLAPHFRSDMMAATIQVQRICHVDLGTN